jgi:hypothetical protein
MSFPLKRAIKGSVAVEASIVMPVILTAFFLTIVFFNTLYLEIKMDRCLHSSVRKLMLDYSDYSLFNGIVENIAKKEILKERFDKKLQEEMIFRKIDKRVESVTTDFSGLFNYGESEGYLYCRFRISGIGFSRKIYFKAIGSGVLKEAEWDGIWDIEPMLRGRIIAGKLGGNMDEYFELISRFRDGEACVIKSINPDLESYMISGGVYEQIFPYAERLAACMGPIEGKAITSRKLILVVPGDPKNTFLTNDIRMIESDCLQRGIVFECIRYGFLYK